MPPETTSHDESPGRGALPVFKTIDQPEDDLNLEVTTILGEEETPDLQPPTSRPDPAADRPSTSSTPNPSPGAGERESKLRSLLTASTSEFSQDSADATADMVKAMAMVAGVAANRRTTRRTNTQTSKWLLAESEADALGTAIGNIVGRRVPDDIAGPDAADVMVIVATGLGYSMRQAMGISPGELAHASAVDIPIDVDPHSASDEGGDGY